MATTVSRSQPLAVAWDVLPNTETVEFRLTAPNATIQCRFDAQLGLGDVPVELLELLDPTTKGSMGAAPFNQEDVEVDGWTISLVAMNVAVQQGGLASAKNVVIQ